MRGMVFAALFAAATTHPGSAQQPTLPTSTADERTQAPAVIADHAGKLSAYVAQRAVTCK